MLTRRRGNLLYRYDITKFSATDTSMCILIECCDECSLREKNVGRFLLFDIEFGRWAVHRWNAKSQGSTVLVVVFFFFFAIKIDWIYARCV